MITLLQNLIGTIAEDQSSECMSLSLRGHGMYESEFVWKKKNMKLKIYGKLSQNWSDSLSLYALTYKYNKKNYVFSIPFYTFNNSTKGNCFLKLL